MQLLLQQVKTQAEQTHSMQLQYFAHQMNLARPRLNTEATLILPAKFH